MDLWITLRDGRTVPMTGVTAISSIDTVGTATQYVGSSITLGSPNVSVSDTATIRPGSSVYGSGIPTGATVLSITNAGTFVMSANATATIGTVDITVLSVTDADRSLLQVNSGWYRDIFTGTTPLSYSSGDVINLTSLPVPALSAVIYGDTVSITPPSSSGAGKINGSITSNDINATTSDEIAHAPLRGASWLESLWVFTCTVSAETLPLYYRKYDVVGFCNVAPSL